MTEFVISKRLKLAVIYCDGDVSLQDPRDNEAVLIDKAEAAAIIAHLRHVFELE